MACFAPLSTIKTQPEMSKPHIALQMGGATGAMRGARYRRHYRW
jgi:hypothetical protein